jgi:NAD-dependent dihydropyrimidine dehydrogenase PreA subunit
LIPSPFKIGRDFVKEMLTTMPHTIVTEVCEGVADCVAACPVACIHPGPGKNSQGTDWFWIDFQTCIDCAICLQVCPVEGAIVPEERADLQQTPQ